VPAALGRFEKEFVFRRICRACNSQIGQCEEHLVRCSPAAVIRRLVSPDTKRNKRGHGWVGAKGAPPPEFWIDHIDHHELVDASKDNPQNVLLIEQLVVMDKNQNEYHVRLFPGMTPEQLRSKLGVRGIVPVGKSYLYAESRSWDGYVELLEAVWPGSTVVHEGTTEPGEYSFRGTAKFVLHEDYWRALAKIGFHYYLLNTRRPFRGDEPEFSAIRQFILKGGDWRPFFSGARSIFCQPFGRLPGGLATLPESWTHVLAADESGTSAVAAVCLFAGPKYAAPTYHVRLGEFRSPLVVPGAMFTHAYLYSGESWPKDGVGTVVRGTLTQIPGPIAAANRRLSLAVNSMRRSDAGPGGRSGLGRS
jgi:hypothetical protein